MRSSQCRPVNQKRPARPIPKPGGPTRAQKGHHRRGPPNDPHDFHSGYPPRSVSSSWDRLLSDRGQQKCTALDQGVKKVRLLAKVRLGSNPDAGSGSLSGTTILEKNGPVIGRPLFVLSSGGFHGNVGGEERPEREARRVPASAACRYPRPQGYASGSVCSRWCPKVVKRK